MELSYSGSFCHKQYQGPLFLFEGGLRPSFFRGYLSGNLEADLILCIPSLLTEREGSGQASQRQLPLYLSHPVLAKADLVQALLHRLKDIFIHPPQVPDLLRVQGTLYHEVERLHLTAWLLDPKTNSFLNQS